MSEERQRHPALVQAETSYNLAAAAMRMARDGLIATWRDLIHESQMEVGGNPRLLHDVMDSMDDHLNHRVKKNEQIIETELGNVESKS